MEEPMELPPGFRFHPTDEELITHYLSPKVMDSRYCAIAIGEVDLNKVEPWDLPRRAKMGEKEWYFFCVRDRKYPTGLRTNRATVAGYWKATGKDKEIYKGKRLVGMKKTLVFYRGRAPRGQKTNWIMHEYRLEGKHSLYNNLPKSAKNDWVISRVFEKSEGGKKIHISEDELRASNLPPLMDFSYGQARSAEGDASHVTCFSNPMEDHHQKPQQEGEEEEDMVDSFNSSLFLPPEPLFPTNYVPNTENFEYPDAYLLQDQSVLRFLMKSEEGVSTGNSSMVSDHEMGRSSYQNQDDPITLSGPVDLDCLWNY